MKNKRTDDKIQKKQELLGQFSSTVEQELYHYEWRNNDEKIDLKFNQRNKISCKK